MITNVFSKNQPYNVFNYVVMLIMRMVPWLYTRKRDQAVHARNELSCARGCWCSFDGDDGDDDDDADDSDDDGDDDVVYDGDNGMTMMMMVMMMMMMTVMMVMTVVMA